MKKWENEGIILSIKKHSEHGLLVSLFTKEFGLWKGWMRQNKKHIFQPGQIVYAEWSARLEEQLGRFHCEIKKDTSATFFNEPQKLKMLNCMLIFLDTCLSERQSYPRLYEHSLELLLQSFTDEHYPYAYFLWELDFLSEMGFGLDLTKCAVTASKEELTYISPRTGRSVSQEVAEPYAEKLFPYPDFIKEWIKTGKISLFEEEELPTASKMLLHFLEQFLWIHQSKPFPKLRYDF